MDIQIQSLGFDADKKLLDFIRGKINKLINTNYYDILCRSAK